MATRYYIGSGGDWNTDANWATSSGGAGPASYPTASDDAIFDDNSGDCTLDASAACLSLTIGTSGKLYAGTLDAASFGIAIGTGGLDCTYGGSATLDMGTGTWTCSGNWDASDVGTLTRDTATIQMTGTGVTWTSKRVDTLEVSGTVTVSSGVQELDNTTVTGTLTVNSPALFYTYVSITVATGTLTGTGTLEAANYNNSVTGGGTWTIANSNLRYNSTLNAGTYGGTWYIPHQAAGGSGNPNELTIGGHVTWTGDVTFEANVSGSTYTINNGGNYNLTFQGDVSCVESGGGTLAWTKGSGTITLSGTNNQDIDFNGLDIELINVNKAGDVGTVTFSGNGTADGLDLDAAALVDFADNLTMTWGASGFVIDHGGNCNMGTNTIHYMSGDYDTYNISGGHNPETSHIIFTGTSLVTFYSSGRTHFYDMTVQNGANAQISAGYGICVGTNDTNIDGTLNVSSGYYQVQRDGNLYVSSTGDIYGDGTTNSTLEIRWPSAGNGIPTMDGTIRDLVLLWPWGEANAVFAAATYDCTVKCRAGAGLSGTLTLNGSYTFDALELECNNTGDTCLVDRVTYDAPLTINGNLILDIDQSGGIVQISSASTPIILQGDLVDEVIAGGLADLSYNDITLTGTNDQDWDQPATAIIGTLTINKTAGTVTPLSTLNCQEFIGQDGTFDPNAQTINVITTGGGTGNCDWQSNFEFVNHEDAFNSCSWSIAGNFTADGQSLKATGGFVDDVPAAIGSGTSRSFTMDGQYIQVPLEDPIKPTAAVSVAGWFYVLEWDQYLNICGMANPGDVGYSLQLRGNICPDTHPSFVIVTDVQTVYANIQVPLETFACDSWHHLVGVYDGSFVRLYIDGVESLPAASCTGNINYGSYAQIAIGGDSTRTRWLTGKIDDVRIYRDALTAAEVMYLFTNGVSGSDPGDVDLVGYWDFDGDLVDKAVYKSDVPAVMSGTSRYFDKIDDYIHIGTSDVFNLTSNFTLCGWIKTSTWNGGGIIMSRRDADVNPASYMFYASGGSGDDDLTFNWYNGGSWYAARVNDVYTDQTWHHVAVVITDNTQIDFYVDGSFVGTDSDAQPIVEQANGKEFSIGAINGGVDYFDGWMKDLRVYNDKLTSDELTYLATNGGGGSNPGTDNLVGHWKFDGNLLDETDNNNHGTAYGTIDGTSVGLDCVCWSVGE
jgi:hypothetical protein